MGIDIYACGERLTDGKWEYVPVDLFVDFYRDFGMYAALCKNASKGMPADASESARMKLSAHTWTFSVMLKDIPDGLYEFLDREKRLADEHGVERLIFCFDGEPVWTYSTP